MVKTLDAGELKSLNEWFVRSFDKWPRIYGHPAITVIEYNADRVTVRVDTSEKLLIRPRERIPLIKRVEKIFAYPVPFKPSEYKIMIYRKDVSNGFMVDANKVNTTWLTGLLSKFQVQSERNKGTGPDLVYIWKFQDTDNIGVRFEK